MIPKPQPANTSAPQETIDPLQTVAPQGAQAKPAKAHAAGSAPSGSNPSGSNPSGSAPRSLGHDSSSDLFATQAPQEPEGSAQRFHVLRELNKGNLGVVYVALDDELKREIALKRIREDRSDSERARDSFVREAEVTGKLEHPGIVPVYSLGKDTEGRMFYAMRLIRGVDLEHAIDAFHQSVRTGKLNYDGPELRTLVRHLVSVCHTIAYAHSRGVLHRDLKPANIMLGPYGETLVVDWGLAKPTGQVSDTVESIASSVHLSESFESPLETSTTSFVETIEGATIGSPVYAPIEQLVGQVDLIDNRSDIYSLGAILFQLLTGTVPIKTHSLQDLISKVQRGKYQLRAKCFQKCPNRSVRFVFARCEPNRRSLPRRYNFSKRDRELVE